MSVPNQIPESNYVGNGTTTTFAANFDYASDSDVFVTVNGVTPEIGQATFANGVFTFTTAPASGAAVRVYRSTPIERDTEYDNHDNVFRPRVVNIDFDRIWFVLQEYLLSIGITNQRISKEISDRIQADADMLNYITNEDNDLKQDYIERDDKLKLYINQLIGAVTGDPSFTGINAEFVKDSSGKNQQEVNNYLSSEVDKKAPLSVTEELDQRKVDKVDVQQQFSAQQEVIDTKAPISTTNELQQQKADKSYVDSALTNFQNGAVKAYPTLADANADIANIALNTKVSVLSATEGGDYYKASADATSLTKSPWDPIKQSTSYTNEKTKNIEESSAKNLDEAVDVNLNVYRYTDPSGGLHLSGLDHSVQDSINAKFSNEAANRMIYQNILIAKYSAIKNLVPVATQVEDGLRARMPAAIKTPTGLVYFYHKQIPTFDGDFQGSELWKAIISIDDSLNVTVVSRELFLAPDQPRGIVKHPMLGRTSDGRILLVFEKRVEVNEKYVQYQCYSSDEGLTFTNPVAMTMTGVNPAGANGVGVLGTTGTIVTAKNNRLIVPMYTTGGTCYCIYSDDDGVTWTFSAWVNPSQVSGFEPSISLDMNNNLIMDVRPKTPSSRLKAKSLDNGLTWQAMTTQQVPSTTNQGVIFLDKEIGMMIQTTNANSTSGSRDHYSLFLSYDNAKTFPFSYMPFAPTWYGGYSQVLKWKDGIYIIAIEYADAYIASNVNENSGLLILSLSEVMRNVSLN